MSNTVDNRVVEMQFKNEDFERGIKQTITSLDGLKKALEINTNSLDLSRVQREADKLNLANITTAVEALSDRFSNLGIVGMTVMQNLTNKAIGLVERLGQISIGQIITGGKGRAQKVADARFKLDGLLNDGEKVAEVFQEASDSVSDTAFGLDEAVNIAAMLTGSGVDFVRTMNESGEEISDLDVALRGIAGAAAMSNSSFEDIGRIFAQVKTAGRLMGQDMMQLQGRTINVVAELSKYLNKTQAEVQEMVHKGEIDFNTFAAAMDNSFGKQAKKSNETLQGVLANTRAALSKIGEIFYSGIIENKDLIAFLGNLKDRLNEFKDTLKPLGGPFANIISSIGRLGTSILNLFSIGGSKKWSSFIELAASAMERVSGFIDKITEKISTFANESGISEVAEEVKETVESIDESFEKVKEIANDIWFGKSKGYNQYGNGQARKDALGDMYNQAQAYVNAMKQANFDMEEADKIYAQMSIQNAEEVVAAKEEVNKATEDESKKAVESAKSYHAFGSIFGALVSMFKSGVKTVKTIGKAFKNVFSFKGAKAKITELVEKFAEFLKAFELTEERAGKLQTFFEGLFGIFKMVGGVVIDLASNGFGLLAKVIPTIIDAILGLGEKIGNALKRFKEFVDSNDLLVRAGNLIVGTFTKVSGVVKEFFSRFKELPAVQQLKDEFIDIVQNVGKKLLDFFRDAKGAVGDFFGSMDEGDASTMDRILGGINTALQTFLDLSSQGKDNVKKFLGKFKEGGDLEKTTLSLSAMGDNYEKLKKQGEALSKSKNITEFIDNMRTATGDGPGGGFGSKAKETIGNITDSLANLDVAKMGLLGLSGALVAFTLSFSYMTIHISDAINTFAALPKNVIGVLKSITGAFNGVRDYFRRKGVAQIITQVAVAIAVLAASLAALTLVDPDKLMNAAQSMSVIMGVMTIMVVALAQLTKSQKSAKKFNTMMDAFSKIILSMAASAFLLSAAMYALSNIEWKKDTWTSLGVLVGLMASLIGVIAIINALGPEIKTSGVWLIFYAGSVLLLTTALNQLAKLKVDKIKGKMLVLAEAMAIVAGVAIASSKMTFGSGAAVLAVVASLVAIELAFKWVMKYGISAKDITDNLGNLVILIVMMMALAGYIKLLSKAMSNKPEGIVGILITVIFTLIAFTSSLKKLSKLKPGKLLTAVFALTVLMAALAGLIFVIGKVGQASRIKQAGKMMIQLALALGLMSLVIAFLGSMTQDTLEQGYLAVVFISVILGILIAVTKLSGNINPKTFVAMIGVMATLAVLVALMSFIEDKESLMQAALIFGALLIEFGIAMFLATSGARKVDPKAIEKLVLMVIAIGGLLAGLMYISEGDYLLMLSAAGAMALVLLALGKCAQIMMTAFTAKGVGEQKMRMVNRTILTMTAIIMAIGVALSAITFVANGDWASILAAAGAIFIVLTALTAVFTFISKKLSAKKTDVDKIKNLNMLLIAIGAIAVAMSPLLYFSHSGRQIIAAAGSLALVLAALTGVYFALSLIKANGKDMMVKAGALAIMALSLLPAAAALAILAQYDTSGMIEAAKAIAIVIGVIAAALGVLMLISSTGTGFAVILAIAAAISIVALSLAVSAKIISKAIGKIIDAIKELTKIEYDKIDTQKLNELVILLLKMSLTSLVTAIGITALGAALTVLGVGVLAVGLGLSLLIVTATGLIKALTALIKAINAMDFTKVSNGIKMVGVTLKGFITGIAASFAMAFIVFLNTLRMNIKVIGETIKDLILTILDILISAKVDIAERIIEGLTELFSMLEEKLPPLFEHVNNLLISLLTMIAENARVYGYLGSVIAIEFAIGIMQGLADSAEDLVDTAVWLTLSMIRAIRNTFDKYKDLLADGLKGIFFKGSAGFWKYMKAWQDVNNPLGKLLGINDFFALEANDLDETAGYLFDELDEDWEAHSKEHADKHAESVAKNEESAAKNIDMSKVHDQYALKARQATDTTTESRQSAEDNVEAYNGGYVDALSRKKDELINGVKDYAVGAFTGGTSKAQPEMEVVARRSATGLSDYTVEQMKKEGWKLNEAGTEWIKEIPKGMEEGADKQSDPFTSVLGGFLGLNGDKSGMGGVMSDWMGQMSTNGEDGAGNFIDGLMGKFTDQEALNNIHDATFDFGEYAKMGWDESVDSNSPAKEAIKRAGYWLEGLLIPLESSKSNKALYDASAKNAEAVKNSFTESMKNVPEFGNNLTYTPTIKPVLDSSNMGQYGGLMDVINNPATVQLAADSQLSIRDANQFKLAQQMEQLNSNISKMANQDLSKVMDGVAINVNADTTVDGTVLRKTASRYTINQINEQEQAILMAKGARA